MCRFKKMKVLQCTVMYNHRHIARQIILHFDFDKSTALWSDMLAVFRYTLHENRDFVLIEESFEILFKIQTF